MLSLPLLLALQHANAATFTVSDLAGLQSAIAGAAPGGNHTFIVEDDIVGIGALDFSAFTGSIIIDADSGDPAVQDFYLVVSEIQTPLTGALELRNVRAGSSTVRCIGQDPSTRSTLVLDSAEFIGEKFSGGLVAGFRFEDCDATITNSVLSGMNGTSQNPFDPNSFYTVGGAIYALRGSLTLGTATSAGTAPREWTVAGNDINGNEATFGGALFLDGVETIVIQGNNFSYNYANDFNLYDPSFEAVTGFVGPDLFGARALEAGGGSLYILGGGSDEATLRFNEFTSNFAWDDAAVRIQDTDNLDIHNNLFAQNWAIHVGGALGVKFTRSGITRPKVNNNTFAGNSAGLSYILEEVIVVGGGGHARFDGEIPEFRNNVVAYAYYGGGVLGVDNAGAQFEQGDMFNDYFRYNLFYDNCDTYACAAGQFGDMPTTGNFAAYALHTSNIINDDPDFIYFGDVRDDEVDNDAYPDVFCTQYYSPAVRAGDPDLPNFGRTAQSDIGYCGGLEGDFINRDRDQDGFEQYYDCFDEPGVVSIGGAAAEDVFPGASEVCDFLDNDCDGEVDEDFINAWYPDLDGDLFGDFDAVAVLSCDQPDPTFVGDKTDCDDTDGGVNPGMPEVCNEVDDDCDGVTNEVGAGSGVTETTVYTDADGDGYGGLSSGRVACDQGQGQAYFPTSTEEATGIPGSAPVVQAIDGAIVEGGDCVDSNDLVNPGAEEVCDLVDNDCDGIADNLVGGGSELYFRDTDGDGFGDNLDSSYFCEPPTDGSWVLQGGDCDEGNPTLNPGQAEACDTVDNDCNGLVDDDPPSEPVLYNDFDGDGYGNPATAVRVCNAPVGYVQVGGDCDDNDPTVGECSECGCQATPTPGSAGLMLVALTGLLGLRRRRA